MAENETELWEQKIRDYLGTFGAYRLDVTESQGDRATAIFCNRNGDYFLITGNVNEDASKARSLGPYDSLKKLEDGRYRGIVKDMLGFTATSILDSEGKVLKTDKLMPWEKMAILFPDRYRW
jgi:hypothetical protein